MRKPRRALREHLFNPAHVVRETHLTPPNAADALRTLALNEARWEAVLDSAQDAIISMGPRGIVTLFNRAAESIFGYRRAEVLGHNVTMLMPAPYRDEHARYVQRYEQTGVPRAIGRIRDVQAQRKNGEVFPIELSVSEARFGGERLYTAIIRDVSAHARAQAQLHEFEQRARQHERLADVGAITAKVVHDLGNPLGAISMQAQLLIRRLQCGTTDPAGLLPVADRILAAVHRLDSIIHEFSTFSREQRLELRDVALPDVLHELRDLWFPLASSRDIDLLLDVPTPELPAVRADGHKLRRVLENLMKNAIEAIDRGPGRVTVRLVGNRHDPEVRISVSDTGPGILPTLEVFGLFETTKPDGTGLGLAVARQIVLAHGGRISHEPLAPHGTAFHIDLPRRGPAVSEHQAAAR